ncbi:hypothetical protein QF034_000951 [Streptomyces africanus]|uniref:Transposase n=1 Tax=Streptomyces africanus TaxID=231024 RepID=A0ABU0QH58_9ACTN|nr:hypothetical protein [Streptomyces africanus]
MHDHGLHDQLVVVLVVLTRRLKSLSSGAIHEMRARRQ